MKAAAPREFLGSLESLRGLAALLVALFHVQFANPTYELGIVRNGYLLVDLFFVLSGFVMSHAYLGRLGTRAEVREYLWLRLGRIYPLHLATLGVFFAIELARFAAERGGRALGSPAFSVNGPWELLANLLMIHAHGLTTDLTFNRPSWSIGAELWAYLAFAGFAVGARSARGRVAVAALIAVSAYVGLWWWHPADLDLTWNYGVVRCLGGFFLGVLTHFAVAAAPPWARALAGPGSLVALVGLVALLVASRAGSLDYAAPLASAVLIGAVALARDGRVARALGARPLVWLGRVSFSVYMVHMAVLRVVVVALKAATGAAQGPDGLVPLPPGVGLVGVVVYVSALLGVSALTYRAVEDPARRWARTAAKRWWGPPAPADAGALVARSG